MFETKDQRNLTCTMPEENVNEDSNKVMNTVAEVANKNKMDSKEESTTVTQDTPMKVSANQSSNKEHTTIEKDFKKSSDNTKTQECPKELNSNQTSNNFKHTTIEKDMDISSNNAETQGNPKKLNVNQSSNNSVPTTKTDETKCISFEASQEDRILDTNIGNQTMADQSTHNAANTDLKNATDGTIKVPDKDKKSNVKCGNLNINHPSNLEAMETTVINDSSIQSNEEQTTINKLSDSHQNVHLEAVNQTNDKVIDLVSPEKYPRVQNTNIKNENGPVLEKLSNVTFYDDIDQGSASIKIIPVKHVHIRTVMQALGIDLIAEKELYEKYCEMYCTKTMKVRKLIWKGGPIEQIREDDDENSCKILFIALPKDWGRSHLKVLLHIKTSVDPNARFVKMVILNDERRRKDGNYYLLRFLTHEECIQVCSDLQNVKLFGKNIEFKLDIGYKLSKNAPILGPLADLEIRLNTYQINSHQYKQFRNVIHKKEPYSDSKTDREVVIKKEISEKSVELVDLTGYQTEDNLNQNKTSEIVMTEVPTCSKEVTDEAPSEAKLYNKIDTTESDLLGESDENHCRIVQIFHLPKKSPQGAMEKLLKYHTRFGDVPMELKVPYTGICLLQCPTHEIAVKIVKDLNGFMFFGKILKFQLDIGHTVTRAFLPAHPQFSSSVVPDVPNVPEPGAPEPSVPELSVLKPSAPGPNVPEPSAPEPSVRKPSAPEPSVPGPSVWKPNAPRPSEPKPNAPGPSEPKPNAPGPSEPEPSTPESSVRKISALEPSVRKPNTPGPSVHKPSTPQPSVRKLSEPESSVHKPSASGPSVHTPSAPEPSVHNPSAPGPSVYTPSAPGPSVREPSVPEQESNKRKLDTETESASKKLKFKDIIAYEQPKFLPLREYNRETYGLSLYYLKSISVNLPLTESVFVYNLHIDVDEAKLREVFGLAGFVKNVELNGPPFPKAKITFDHPVEAVQAIALFNKQMLYHNMITVKMNHKTKIPLPSGLQTIGKGFCSNGEPMTGIRNQVELRHLQRILANLGHMKEVTLVDEPFCVTYVDPNQVPPKPLCKRKRGLSKISVAQSDSTPDVKVPTLNNSDQPSNKPTTPVATPSVAANIANTSNESVAENSTNKSKQINGSAIALGAILAQHGLIDKNYDCEDIDSILNAIRNCKDRISQTASGSVDESNISTAMNPSNESKQNTFKTQHNWPNVVPTGINRDGDGTNDAQKSPNWGQNNPNTDSESINIPPLMSVKTPYAPGTHLNTSPFDVSAPNNDPIPSNMNQTIPHKRQREPDMCDPAVRWEHIPRVSNTPPMLNFPQYAMPVPIHNMPISVQNRQHFNQSLLVDKPYYQNIQQEYHQRQQYELSSKHEDIYQDLYDYHTRSRTEKTKAIEEPRASLVIFKNLPPSVTVNALNNKMLEVGDVVFTNITGRGRAIVHFKYSKDAERCIRLFHLSKVDKQVIEVAYV